MPQTWTALATAVTYSASAKSMLGLFNGVGSGRILRVYRIWCLNAQTAAITGVFPTIQLFRTTAQSAGTTITPVARDTTNTALPAQVLCATNGTVTTSSLLRRFLYFTDEPTVSGAVSQQILWTRPVVGGFWDVGYMDPQTEPITLREGQGISVHIAGIASPAGVTDFEIEFTNLAT